MDTQWRKGSKQFIDFALTLTDPEGTLTLSEVEAIPFEVLVVRGAATPELTDLGWAAPSVPISVAAVTGGGFKVSVQHLYQALDLGLHSVFVRFGPTPEEPVYQAVTFVVL